ncbi:DciA family protein [Photobacterium sp. CCB-ST2H9]|uniref:DUF721 domain-containing protein n=1 Tax=unclassified Photobacterium TaxID=2628852 RepID=UPI002004EC4C|nr:DciA family protein [Photobacterium sp. CCB-ST2H9]UTM57706.1 DciA family protein [Photobacterium sp. CCB-ST2H9]
MRDHRPQTTASLLDDDSALGNIQQRAMALHKLNSQVQQYLSCAQACRVSNYRQGILVIEVASAAWSMRLNYERNQLINRLREHTLPKLQDIQISINPSLAAEPIQADKTPVLKRKPISERAAQSLMETAQDAPAKIKARLERLAALANKNK